MVFWSAVVPLLFTLDPLYMYIYIYIYIYIYMNYIVNHCEQTLQSKHRYSTICDSEIQSTRYGRLINADEFCSAAGSDLSYS